MIAIVNIDPNPRAKGKHLYSLRINKQEICRFYHHREDKLYTCLFSAAGAAYNHEQEEAVKAMIKLQEGRE